MFEKEQESTPCLAEEAAASEETVRIRRTSTQTQSDSTVTRFGSASVAIQGGPQSLYLTLFCLFVKQGDSSKTKTKVWQNKSKGARKTAKSKKKKLTKKKATPAPAKTKQANGNITGNVRIQPQLS